MSSEVFLHVFGAAVLVFLLYRGMKPKQKARQENYLEEMEFERHLAQMQREKRQPGDENKPSS